MRGQDSVGYNTIVKCAVQAKCTGAQRKERAGKIWGGCKGKETQWDSRWVKLEKILLKKIKDKNKRQKTHDFVVSMNLSPPGW